MEDKKIKILIYALTAPNSGITQYILNLLSVINLDDISFDIVSFRNDRLRNWCKQHNRKYYEMDKSMYKHPILYRKFHKELFQPDAGYDIVHFHNSTIQSLVPFKMAQKSGCKKTILHSHATRMESNSSLYRNVFTKLHCFLRNYINRYITDYAACSSAAAEWMFGPYTKHAKIMKNAIKTEAFRFDSEIRKKKRHELHLENRYTIGHIGRFTYPKNHEYLIDLFQQVLLVDSSAVLLLIGEGEQEAYIKHKVRDLGIENSIIFAGIRSDIPDMLQAMDVFVFPSRFEGFPIVLVEAQAAGLPCIVADTVSKETELTDIIQYISLDAPKKNWVEMIMKYKNYQKTHESCNQIRQAGYDLSLQADVMYKFYKKGINKQ